MRGTRVAAPAVSDRRVKEGLGHIRTSGLSLIAEVGDKMEPRRRRRVGGTFFGRPEHLLELSQSPFAHSRHTYDPGSTGLERLNLNEDSYSSVPDQRTPIQGPRSKH